MLLLSGCGKGEQEAIADSTEEDFYDSIEKETCTEMFCNWQGIMLGNGEIWIAEIDGELKVTAINVTE